MDATTLEQVLVDRQGVAAGATELIGPVHVLETTPKPDGGTTYQVSASRLVPVDEDDPDLASVYIPVPVTAAVEVDEKDAVVGVAVPDPDPSLDHEARAFTRNLIANGAVRGLARSGPVRRGPTGPPPRSTHEITTDASGRRVIRRTGFTTTFAPTLDGRAHDGTDITLDSPVDSKGGTHK